MKCAECHGLYLKIGKVKNVQRYKCKECGKTRQRKYRKTLIKEEKYERVRILNNEGSSIRSIASM